MPGGKAGAGAHLAFKPVGSAIVIPVGMAAKWPGAMLIGCWPG